MNARQLEIFHAVMRSGTITGAAAFLGISQPAVSKAMRAIEQQLGFKLLRPIKGRLYPTPEAQRLLPEATASFQKANPAVRLSSHLLPAREVAEAVAAGEADFGLTLSPVQLPGLTVRTLGAAEMVFVAPIGHPLLERETITPVDLAPHPLISFGRETHFGQ